MTLRTSLKHADYKVEILRASLKYADYKVRTIVAFAAHHDKIIARLAIDFGNWDAGRDRREIVKSIYDAFQTMSTTSSVNMPDSSWVTEKEQEECLGGNKSERGTHTSRLQKLDRTRISRQLDFPMVNKQSKD